MSISFEPYGSPRAGALVDLWNASIGSDFPMDLRLWRQNVDGCDRTSPEGSWIAVDGQACAGFVIAKSPNHISAIIVHPEYRRQGIGRKLLERACAALASPEGRTRAAAFTAPLDPPHQLITGQDYAHFFPGVPEPYEGAFEFFQACGWRKTEGWCVDLWRELAAFSIDPSVAAKIEELRRNGIVLQACTPKLTESLLRHVEANFSTRWLNETRSRILMEPDPAEIKVAVRGGDVVGFAHTFTNRSAKLGPSVMWRGLLGAEYGGLGPIGVAKDVRKIGLGLALLNYGVDEVRKAGMTRMAIDWTALVDFYKRAGFKVWKRYIWCVKNL